MSTIVVAIGIVAGMGAWFLWLGWLFERAEKRNLSPKHHPRIGRLGL